MGKRKARKEVNVPPKDNPKKPKMLDNQYFKARRRHARQKLRHERLNMGSNETRNCNVNSQTAQQSQHFKGNLSERFAKRKCKKWRQFEKEDNSAASEGPSTSTSSRSSQDCQSEEIPGFYYDPEKKKYFKILSSNNSVNVVTKEKIESDQAERQRQKDLSNLSSLSPTKDSIFHSPVNLARVLPRHQRGEIRPYQMENRMLISNIDSLQPSGSWTVVGTPDGVPESLEHMMFMDCTQDRTKLVGMWSVKDSVKQRLQLLYLNEKTRTNKQVAPLSLSVDATDTTVVQSWNKISNVCWAPFSKSPESNNVLYTTMCHAGYAFSLAFIRNLDRTRSEREVFDYNLGSLVTWTCAWNYHKQRFSVGSEKRGMLVDVETRRCWWFDCLTDPFAQVFSPDCGNYLYSGGRNGMVLCHDMRSLGSTPAKYVRHRTSVCSVKVTNCGTYVLSADISGKAIMWDVRTQRPVMDYLGLFNRYSRIPLQIDETEQILYGAGQDCYTRFWCLKTGKLLKSLPPPCSAARETIPSIQYSTRWGDRAGNAGLIMGLGDELHFYSGHV